MRRCKHHTVRWCIRLRMAETRRDSEADATACPAERVYKHKNGAMRIEMVGLRYVPEFSEAEP